MKICLFGITGIPTGNHNVKDARLDEAHKLVEAQKKSYAQVILADEKEMAQRFVGQLYDLFVEHQGLLLTLMAAQTLSEEELAETGIADIRRALTLLSQIGAEGMRIRGMRTSNPDLPAHSTVAMIAGMAALRSTYFGSQPPPRQAIVDELVQAILHGFLHRHD